MTFGFVSSPPDGLSDVELSRHPSWRRYTAKYRRKQRLVRDLWIMSGVVMIGAPVGAMLALALGTTLISFVILDETG